MDRRLTAMCTTKMQKEEKGFFHKKSSLILNVLRHIDTNSFLFFSARVDIIICLTHSCRVYFKPALKSYNFQIEMTVPLSAVKTVLLQYLRDPPRTVTVARAVRTGMVKMEQVYSPSSDSCTSEMVMESSVGVERCSWMRLSLRAEDKEEKGYQ